MNIFRYLGDFSHLLSFVLLFYKINTSKSVAGISLKSQILYVVVFLFRYVDLFWNFASLYNSVLKILFIVASVAVVYVMKFVKPQMSTYDPEADNFNGSTFGIPNIYGLVGICAVLGLVINENHFSLFEIGWSFSLWLEAVAIFPQITMIQKQGECENLNSHYVAALGSYRGFYLLNWLWRFFSTGYWHAIPVITGLIQTAVYGDFFYYYLKSKRAGLNASVKVPTLPV